MKEFKRPKSLSEKMLYCPGCSHGVIHRILAESISELGIQGETILVGSAGCSVFCIDYFNTDTINAPHGRSPAVATGLKRSSPSSIVITYQGDGDLAAIGMAEIVHAAARGENITVIFVNNATYGMTGGQMAPTTLQDQVTTTTPTGRHVEYDGYPIRVCELLATLSGSRYIERTSVHDVKHILKTKNAIKNALKVQMKDGGFSLVEILSACPTNWKKTPVESMKWIEDVLIKHYPLGIVKLGNFKG